MRFIKDKNRNKLVKLFKGSTSAIVQETKSYKDTNYYSLCIQLKAEYPFSYIYEYQDNYKEIASVWNCHKKTAKNRVKRLLETGYAVEEGKTLRFLSNTTIRRKYAVKSTKKAHNYEYVKAEDVANAVKAQPITDNINRQTKALKKKTNKSAAKKDTPGSQLTYKELIKRSPLAHLNCVDTTLLSQNKAAQLLGYKSKSSGRRALRRLSTAKFLEIESNVIPITKDEFNFYKTIAPAKLLIKGRGNQAEFFVCNANTVKIATREPVIPFIKRTYSVTTPRFLDNY